MLCGFLQQLQEFGGPEFDKPDLVKGSVGSLKNLGMPVAGGGGGGVVIKNSSGSGSLARPNTNATKARYNVCPFLYYLSYKIYLFNLSLYKSIINTYNLYIYLRIISNFFISFYFRFPRVIWCS